MVDTQSLRVDKFGQDLSCKDKIYVIYDGESSLCDILPVVLCTESYILPVVLCPES